jgi:hypothetical protein
MNLVILLISIVLFLASLPLPTSSKLGKASKYILIYLSGMMMGMCIISAMYNDWISF